MDYSGIVKKYRELRGYNVPQLAEAMGINKQTIYAWEKGDYGISEENLDKLSAVLGVKFTPMGVLETTGSTPVREIPFYDAYAVGGSGILADQASVGEPTEMINPGTWFRTAKGALRIYGHSMFPKYPSGSIVAFKIADKDVIIWGEDYVLELEDRRIIKRLERHKDGEFVSAVSYNRSEDYVYAPVDIPKAKIKRLFMVLGKIELEASV